MHRLFPIIITIGDFYMMLVLVFMWINSRGRFIFTDCVVKNRAAIALPWNEYRREGDSFFFFSIAVMFVGLVILVAFVVLIVASKGLFSHSKFATELHTGTVFAFVFVGLIWLAFSVFFAV